MNQSIKTIIAFTAIYLVWGSTFLGVSIALQSFPPFLLSALRFLTGGLLLACWCRYRKEPIPSSKELVNFSVWGIVLFGGGVIAVVWAQQYLPSSLAAIIITTPFWFVVLDRSQWHQNFKSGWIISGLLAGMAGVILLLSQRSSANFEAISLIQVKAILVIIGGSFLWALGSLQLRNAQGSASVYTKTSVHLLAAAIFAFLISFANREFQTFQPGNIRTDAVVALVFLSVVSTTATFLAFIWLIRRKPVAVVGTYSYVNPVVAVLLGVLLKGESVNRLQLIAMLIILSGILFINIPKYKFRGR